MASTTFVRRPENDTLNLQFPLKAHLKGLNAIPGVVVVARLFLSVCVVCLMTIYFVRFNEAETPSMAVGGVCVGLGAARVGGRARSADI